MLTDVFLSAILPIVSLAGVGYLLGRVKHIDVGGLNTVTIYVLAPALVFHSLSTTPVGGLTAVKIAAGIGAYLLVIGVVATAVHRATDATTPTLGALFLVSAFPNAGNYGIPLSDFAFGPVGRSTAVLYLSIQSIYMYTVGAYVASLGSDATDARTAVTKVLRLPLVYAVLAAFLLVRLDAVPPVDGTLMRTLELTGNATIPVMLLLLGIQLANTDYAGALSKVGMANVLKLGVAPVVGIGLALLLGFGDAVVARTFVLEIATPAAITPLMLVIEFRDPSPTGGISDAEYISSVILTSTLLSVPVLTVLIVLLESGVVL
jgi:predicted permease